MYEGRNDKKVFILLPGIIGVTGAFLILIADIIYNHFGGNHTGVGLYISTYFGVFLFPLYWAGFYVVYQGLKPAGFLWSFIPCLLFSFDQSTINVFFHSSYPYLAVINDTLNSNNVAIIETISDMELQIRHYTSFIESVSSIVELILSIWTLIPILAGKSYFPRWVALLFPVVPYVSLMMINIFYNGFFDIVSPYIGSGFMCIFFLTCTFILYRKTIKMEENEEKIL